MYKEDFNSVKIFKSQPINHVINTRRWGEKINLGISVILSPNGQANSRPIITTLKSCFSVNKQMMTVDTKATLFKATMQFSW